MLGGGGGGGRGVCVCSYTENIIWVYIIYMFRSIIHITGSVKGVPVGVYMP